MDLFMIRLENGNSVVLQAESEIEALEYAGLRSDPDAIAKEMSQRSGEHDPAEIYLSMVRSGVGPQNYTIRKLRHFMCDFHLEEDGQFEGPLSANDDTSDEFYVDYPELNKALDFWSGPTEVSGAVAFTDQAFAIEAASKDRHHDNAIADAVAKERTRLLAKLDL